MENIGISGFSGGKRMSHEYSVVSLNMKNLMSPTPRNSVLKSFILALNDSAEALVSLSRGIFTINVSAVNSG